MQSKYTALLSETGEVLIGSASHMQKINDSNLSPRAKRIKCSAAFRPDVAWKQGNTQYYQKFLSNRVLQAVVVGSNITLRDQAFVGAPMSPISTTNALSRLIAESDAHLAAMRKIVH